MSLILAQEEVIPFVAFMHRALYDPLEGYYSSSLPKLGKAGDFITAPELTPLFGKSLGNQCHQILSALSTPMILEYGAGTGRLCVDILRHLEEKDCLPQHYYILEVSGGLRDVQEALIRQSLPHLADRVSWLEHWPDAPFNGLVIANEVLDAMPVHRFLKTAEGILESHIERHDDKLVERFLPCCNSPLLNYVQSLPIDSSPYCSEVNLFLDDWLANNYKFLKQGALILIDYGFPRHEYYHPDRAQGTLMCHYRHQAHTNFLQHPGNQDITAHVDFTAVAEAGLKAGFHIAGYTNQASFLLANDLLSFIPTDSREEIKAKQAIKQLIHPSEMGELFKVMALTKGLDIDLKGFQLLDKRASL